MGLALLLALGACASAQDNSGIRVVQRTPEQFCSGTARAIAGERYAMKRKGVPLAKALEADGGTAAISAVTRAVYASSAASESQAMDAGTAGCLRYFAGR